MSFGLSPRNQVSGEGEEVDVDGLKHEFDGHENEDGVAADENTIDADCEEGGAQDQIVFDGNQGLGFLLLGAGAGDDYCAYQRYQENQGGDLEGDGPLLKEDLGYSGETGALGILDGVGPVGQEEDDGEGGE